MKKVWQSALPVLACVVLWEVVSRSGWISAAIFPPPSKVLAALWGLISSGILVDDLGSSAWRLMVGLLLGSTGGIGIGLLTGRSNMLDRIISPIIQVLRPLPPVAIIPLVIVWFGIGDGAKIFSISFAVFFPVWVSAHIGARSVEQTFIWSAQLLTSSKVKILKRVIFPAAMPFIVTGLRIGIGTAFVMVFVSELAGASSGIGYRISITQLAYRIDEMIAALAVLGGLGAATDQLFVLCVTKMFPWLKHKRA